MNKWREFCEKQRGRERDNLPPWILYFNWSYTLSNIAPPLLPHAVTYAVTSLLSGLWLVSEYLRTISQDETAPIMHYTKRKHFQSLLHTWGCTPISDGSSFYCLHWFTCTREFKGFTLLVFLDINWHVGGGGFLPPRHYLMSTYVKRFFFFFFIFFLKLFVNAWMLALNDRMFADVVDQCMGYDSHLNPSPPFRPLLRTLRMLKCHPSNLVNDSVHTSTSP